VLINDWFIAQMMVMLIVNSRRVLSATSQGIHPLMRKII